MEAFHGITIVGAGLCGTALALALDRKGFMCRIVEARGLNDPENASGVLLTPNGLHVLDKLGILDRILPFCWKADFRTVKNDKDETISKTAAGSEELFGYKNHRLYRRALLDALKDRLAEQRIPVMYNSKFQGIIKDDPEQGVYFWINGVLNCSQLLIGADGLRSSVRDIIQPGVVPEYTGVVGVLGHIKWSAVQWPWPEYERACTLQAPHEALFWMPEVADGSEIMVGKQFHHPNQSRSEWEAQSADKDRLAGFYRDGYDQWNATGKSIIDAVCASKDNLYMWPFMKVPTLDRWASESGQVIIVGDAAHGLPPSSGQGVNQALEDAYSLALILEAQDKKAPVPRSGRSKTLYAWKQMRQERIDQILNWATYVTNVERLTSVKHKESTFKRSVVPNEDSSDMSWLYKPWTDQEILLRFRDIV